VAPALTAAVGVVSDIERQLARLRAREAADGMPQLRTSTMSHIVWCPPEWLARARATLAGLLERHPARTIFLIPDPGRHTKIEARAELKDFHLQGLSREILSEVIEVRLRGAAALHPGSIVLPLLVSDLPVFCRWRGEPAWGSSELEEMVGVADRLVVDSSEWRGVPAAYSHLAALFDRVAVSDIAFSRTLAWRRRLAELWPEIGKMEKLRVEGPRADAELVAGWLRARLKRKVALTRRDAAVVTAMWVDGATVASPGDPLSPSDLLSAELDQFGRDVVYEAAVRAVVSRSG
jgi:glucose-6-phosphate dehydrogenase assembly protein OpcA